jgi:hypothetical protein
MVDLSHVQGASKSTLVPGFCCDFDLVRLLRQFARIPIELAICNGLNSALDIPVLSIFARVFGSKGAGVTHADKFEQWYICLLNVC